jgi:hypothetical protein
MKSTILALLRTSPVIALPLIVRRPPAIHLRTTKTKSKGIRQPREQIACKANRKGFRDRSDEQRLDRVNRTHNKYLSTGPPGDVIFGEWHFDYPKITEWDHDREGDIVWNIHTPQGSGKELFAVVHYIIMEGIVKSIGILRWSGRAESLSSAFTEKKETNML